MSLNVVILAAGKGTRMNSAISKVLHRLAGIPLLEHVVNTAKSLKNSKVFVVYGSGGQQVLDQLQHLPVTWIEQKKQLGTGHAVKQTLSSLTKTGRVLVLYGDVPLISEATLNHLLERTPKDAIGWLTEEVDDPAGLGRIVRDEDGNPVAIVEEKDATPEQKQINEINTGICLIPIKYLKSWLPILKNNNSQGEYYLTDIFAMALKHGVNITTVSPEASVEILGVNDNIQLAELERIWQMQKATEFMRQGLTLLDPTRFDLRGELTFGQDVTIDVNTIIEGKVHIDSNSCIGPNVLLKNAIIGKNVEIKANTIIEDSTVEEDCVIGPFARLRPGAALAKKAKVGNFVEIKKSKIGEGSKVNHLSYIGDTTMGKHVNIGAGTITCNYDGVHKSATKIEDEAFIGSNTSLVAPIEIEKRATIGAGSVITTNAPKNKLTLSRAKQTTIEGWKRPKKEDKK